MGSASATAGCRAKCLSNDIGEHLRPFHHGAPLRGSLQKALLVDGSERSLAFIGDGHIGGEYDHGYRRSVRFGHPRDDIGCATTAWCLSDARFVRQASVGNDHKCRRTLVACHDVRDFPASGIKRVVEDHRGITGYSKDVFNSVFLEQFDQSLGSVHILSSSLLLGYIDSSLSIHRG